MPANLTPQYLEAEEAYRRAKTQQEKLAALEEMLRSIPKHKGTEKMQADIKRRIAKLRDEAARAAKKGKADPYRVEREGAGQVFVVGPPNSGKSSVVAALTSAKVVVADYPFATSAPVPGMMKHENVLIQLVDTPPITPDTFPPAMAAALRGGDGLLVTIDASSDDCLDMLEECVGLRRRPPGTASSWTFSPPKWIWLEPQATPSCWRRSFLTCISSRCHPRPCREWTCCRGTCF